MVWWDDEGDMTYVRKNDWSMRLPLSWYQQTKNNKGRASTVKYYCCDSGFPPPPIQYDTNEALHSTQNHIACPSSSGSVSLSFPSWMFALLSIVHSTRIEEIGISFHQGRHRGVAHYFFLPSFLPTLSILLPQMRRPVPCLLLQGQDVCLRNPHLRSGGSLSTHSSSVPPVPQISVTSCPLQTNMYGKKSNLGQLCLLPDFSTKPGSDSLSVSLLCLAQTTRFVISISLLPDILLSTAPYVFLVFATTGHPRLLQPRRPFLTPKLRKGLYPPSFCPRLNLNILPSNAHPQNSCNRADVTFPHISY